MYRFLIFLTLSFAFNNLLFAQLNFTGELRPRFQIRNGVQQLPDENTNPAIFIAQRTRLNVDYTYSDLFQTYVSIQDVRVWGDQNQLSDEASIGVFQAWAELKLTDKFRFKVGRQEMLYDDGYLFGTLNWREAGRSHDAGIFKFQDSTFQAHLGLAYNNDRGSLFQEDFQNDYYQNLEFLWFKKTFGKSHISGIL